MATTNPVNLDPARDRALEIRALYETLEERFNGKVWSLHEIMLGFTNDAATIGRLILAHDGTWNIDGDVNDQLQHKLAESLWWLFVVADRLDIDMTEAFAATMNRIDTGLRATITSTDSPT
jgi:NTP pyrophosphatase (non-canonical NTP hydrolase)